jgi:Na+/proline symporter
VVRVEKEEPKPEQADAGSVLRGILWVLFVISGIYALGAISIQNNKPYPVGDCLILACKGNADEISAANFAIAYHIAPFIIMLIVLAIAYSAKGKR